MTDTYWHFVQEDEDGTPRLGYGDGRIVKAGETISVDVQQPRLCKAGLHASKRIWDALAHVNAAASLSLCRVTLSGTVVHGGDKSVGTERTVIAMLDSADTGKLLRDWARWCALQVIHLWDAPDVVRQYLETGDESVRAAAWDAASAAWDAASAARAAAGAAAGDAVRAAAWATTSTPNIGPYNAELERRAIQAMGQSNHEAVRGILPHDPDGETSVQRIRKLRGHDDEKGTG